MPHTIDLLHEALALNPNQAFWCEQLGLTRNSIAMAKARQRLSPSLAGNLAHLLGKSTEEIRDWMAVAGLETETHDSPARSRAMALLRTKA